MLKLKFKLLANGPISFIIFVFFSFVRVDASHIVGGDLQYRCLGNNLYSISLTLRRDCLNGNPGAQFDDPAHVGIFDAQGNLINQLGNNGVLMMKLLNNDTLNEIESRDCGLIGGDVCVHTTTYIEQILLPFRPGGYILAYQRCCRNMTINNIVNPQATGATYTIEIKEEALTLCNSSPKMGAYPPIYICGGKPLRFDLQVTDAEGDSVVYKLCTPYVGASQAVPLPTTPSNPPYGLVQFLNPYSLNDMIGGSPALSIDANTGVMTGFATPVIAQYLIAYCVEEYRKGVLLTVLRRDFQINVRLCNSAPEAEFTTDFKLCEFPSEFQCTDQSVDSFSNITSRIWTYDDGNTIQNSVERNPKFNILKEGITKIRLIIESATGCRDTLTKEFDIKLQKPKADFKFEYDKCKFPFELTLNDLSTNPISGTLTREWILDDGINTFTSSQEDPKFNVNKEGQLSVKLYIQNERGCRDSIVKELTILNEKPIADFSMNIANCDFPIAIFGRDSSYSDHSIIVSWSWYLIENMNTQFSSDRNPEFKVNKEGIYKLILVSKTDIGCSDTLIKEINVKIERPIIENSVDTICFGDTIQIKGTFPTGYSYEWIPSTGLSCTDCPNPLAFPSNSSIYILRSYNKFCERQDVVKIVVVSCIFDPCDIFIEEACLPSGMIELSVKNSKGQIINPTIYEHELFWNILASSTHPQYTVLNKNPIQIFNGDEYSLTSKYYSWLPKRAKTIENADICTKRFRKKVTLSCNGPCKDLEFVLSSCEDDYDISKNLSYPLSLCESVCSNECNFIVALFETNGQLVNPTDYEIKWSTGSNGSFVHMMQPYYNNLSVEVKKGDCIWRGKYIKSCTQYGKVIEDKEMKERSIVRISNNLIQELFNKFPEGILVNSTGQVLEREVAKFSFIPPGIYFFVYEENGLRYSIKLIE
ncbi:MAG: hypothetical protein IT267_08560 [Saprospiraceae bacterium]|nr:hypothetical protein [Saprospiraceae bacterium]